MFNEAANLNSKTHHFFIDLTPLGGPTFSEDEETQVRLSLRERLLDLDKERAETKDSRSSSVTFPVY